VSESAKILKPERDKAVQDESMSGSRLFALAGVLDQKLTKGLDQQKLQFGHGEIRSLPEKIRNQWADNLVGAQYLDFPKDSKVKVDIQIKAVSSPDPGIQLKLVLRQFEQVVGDIDFPSFPLLKPGEESHIQFAFTNPKPRKAFSFHLVGEGKDSAIQLQKFEVAISQGG
jgi:hypothetical protein